jgi:hypothetical protein
VRGRGVRAGAERGLDELRERFRDALADAHAHGASYGLLGRVVGLSREGVARIVADD